MRRTRSLLLFVIGIAAGPYLMQTTAAQDTKTAADVVAAVGKTIGAGSVKTIQYSGTGYMTNNSCRPNGPWPKLKVTNYTRVLDYENMASREDYLQSQGGPVCGAGFQPIVGSIHITDSVSGDFAWSYGGAGPDNPPAAGSPAPGAVEQRKFVMAWTPHGWVKAAMASSPTMETKTVDGKPVTVITFLWEGKRKITGYVDSQNLLVRTETMSNSDILGDVTTTTTYSGYKDFSGIKFPMRIRQTASGEPKNDLEPVLDLTVSDVQVNVPTHIDVPDSVRQASHGGGGGEAAGHPLTQKLDEGVWAIYAGGTQSMAIEFKDYSVVVEASGNEARSLAVIAETKRLIPNKPIKYLVNSHHHLDHAGGLRTFVVEGSTIITQEINKPYWEAIFMNPHTVKPDLLARNPKPATFLTVKDHYILTDGTRSLQFDRQIGQEHDEGLLLVFLPEDGILFPSDGVMLNHFRPGTPETRTTVGMGDNTLDNIRRLKLDVKQIVPVHTFPGTFAISFADAKKRIAERGGTGN